MRKRIIRRVQIADMADPVGHVSRRLNLMKIGDVLDFQKQHGMGILLRDVKKLFLSREFSIDATKDRFYYVRREA